MNKENFMGIIFGSFIFFFFALLLAKNTGYYEMKSAKNKILTEQQIKLFEDDIKNGKPIDITEYSKTNEQDYSNSLSNGIYNISLKIENIIDISLKYIFSKANKAVNK